MLMAPDKNKQGVAALIASRIKTEGGADRNAEAFGERAGEPSDGLSEGERAAGEEFLQAVHAKDVAGMVSALKDLMEVAEQGESQDVPEEPKSAFTE